MFSWIGVALSAAVVVCGILMVENLGSSDSGDAGLGSGAMFDAIASRYDITNKVISLGSDSAWRNALINSLDLSDGDRCLDLATGTADVAIMMAQHLDSLSVDGVDPSFNMLEIGRRKVSAAALDRRIVLTLGDAQNLSSVHSAFYDKVSMSFGIRNVPNRTAALKE